MKVINLKRKTIFKFSGLMVFIFTISFVTYSFSMQHYYTVDFSTGLVTATTLNVRSGPGTNYKIVATVKKNEYIRVFAGIGDWYVVQVEGDYVGVVSKKYIKPIYPSTSKSSGTTGSSGSSQSTTTTTLSSDEKEVFDLINQQRTANRITGFKN